MMRKLWRGFVPGAWWVVCLWAFWLAFDVAYFAYSGKVFVSAYVLDLPMFLLNLWSYDYQRRAAISTAADQIWHCMKGGEPE